MGRFERATLRPNTAVLNAWSVSVIVVRACVKTFSIKINNGYQRLIVFFQVTAPKATISTALMPVDGIVSLTIAKREKLKVFIGFRMSTGTELEMHNTVMPG